LALIAGSRIGPYEIVSALGAGGMNEVCRLRDRGGRCYVLGVQRSAVPAATPDDWLVDWRSDGQAIYVYRPRQAPCSYVSRLYTLEGAR
jgi:hypothetical protein